MFFREDYPVTLGLAIKLMPENFTDHLGLSFTLAISH
jgi:hypothetical protein